MGKRFNIIILVTLLFHFYNGLIPAAYGQSLVFGPEFFHDNHSKSHQISRNFSVQDVNQKFILSIQSEGNSEESTGKSIIEINGEIVASLDIGKQLEIFTKPLRLQKKNSVSVNMISGSSTSIIVTIMGIDKHTVTALVPPIGQLVDLSGYASVVFPASSFDTPQQVMIHTSVSASTNALFEAHATGPRLPYEVRISTANKQPEKDVEVELNIPESFFSSPYQIHIFARMHDNPEMSEKHDRFFMISSSVDEVTHTVRTTLPKHAFSTHFGNNETYEAVIIVGLIH